LKRILAFVAVVALSALGLSSTATHARAASVEPPSWGAANLLSAADSDFESGVSGWQAVSNTTVSQNTSSAFHGDASMRLTATASGDQSAKAEMAGNQIDVTGGDTYRVSAWVQTGTAVSGRTVQFGIGSYTSAGAWITWTYGTANTLADTTRWQYVSETITAPPGAAYVLGSPKLTEDNVGGGETLSVDEVLFEPYRAATLIGAEDDSGDCASFSPANTAIGPLQSCKIFYGPTDALPTTWSGTPCATLPTEVTCVITFKDFDNASNDLATFVGLIPAGKPVILIPYQEPENAKVSWSYDGKAGGPAYVAEAENEISVIRGAEKPSSIANIWVADDSEDYQYDPGTSHDDAGNCSYIIPGQYVDMYLDDHYEYSATGNDMANDSPDSGASTEWSTWLGCVDTQDRPIGLAEYGLNCGQTNGTGAMPDALTTSEGMSSDHSYLEGQPAGLPVVLWEYWWDTNGDSSGNCQFTEGGSPDGSQAVTQWKDAETQNGGGGN
jgi:Carbohydrate binding domain